MKTEQAYLYVAKWLALTDQGGPHDTSSRLPSEKLSVYIDRAYRNTIEAIPADNLLGFEMARWCGAMATDAVAIIDRFMNEFGDLSYDELLHDVAPCLKCSTSNDRAFHLGEDVCPHSPINPIPRLEAIAVAAHALALQIEQLDDVGEAALEEALEEAQPFTEKPVIDYVMVVYKAADLAHKCAERAIAQLKSK